MHHPLLRREAPARARRRLLQHPLYAQVTHLPALRAFMSDHVFAVWDFMSQAKRLQQALTCTTLPWCPPADAEAARFINEIVLAEESDTCPDGRVRSHLELYLAAMDEVGACRRRIDAFLERLVAGDAYPAALERANVPAHVAAFVRTTLNTALHGSVVETAAAFLFGREDLIPEMFARLRPLWAADGAAPLFAYYLDRHIELDGDSHGPAARRLLDKLVVDAASEAAAERAAVEALESRIALWEGVLERLPQTVG